jgi:SAM-dependent methyltransferase
MQDQSSYWNDAAGRTFTHPISPDFLAELRPDYRILDYGCGYGRSLAELGALGFTNTVGVDFSRGMITRGRRERPGTDLRLVDRVTVDEPDGCFDAVMLLAVLTCIVEDEAQAAVLQEVRRLLRPGGLLFISDMPLQEDARSRARYAGGGSARPYGVFDTGDGGVVRHHDDRHIATWLRGLEPIADRRVALKTMNGNDAIGVQLVARK